MLNSVKTMVAAGAICLLTARPALPAADAIEGPNKYKQTTRGYVTRIVQGKADAVLADCRKLFRQHPEDPEFHYLMCLAYAALKQPENAVREARDALAHGLPVSRLLAGPRDLLAPLYARLDFQAVCGQPPVRLLHGPMLGCVTDNGARVWVRTLGENTVTVRVSANPQLEPVVAVGSARSTRNADYTATVELKGLTPATQYYYGVSIDGEAVDLKEAPSFTTAPPVGRRGRIRVAFGGGAGYVPWHERMWSTVASDKPDLLLLLGDNVYIDTPEVPQTQRYCYYRRQSRPEYRALVASVPVYAIWDDHDFGTNDCTSFLSLTKPPWKQAVLEVFQQNFVNPSYGGGATAPGVWFRFPWGAVDFFMLDCRFYRQNPRQVNPATMLGPAQKRWLFDALRTSKASFKVIVSSVPWAPGVKPGSKDTWDGFPDEREEIFSFLEANRIDGVVLLSADRHRSDARRIDRPRGYPLYDLMSSKFTNVHTHGLVENAKGSTFLFGYNKTCSYGLLTFDTGKEDPELTYDVVTIDDKVVHSLTLRRSQLSHAARR